jgi:hypothetical protein
MGDGSIVFESNVLIPLPEARDFVIETERKEARSLTLSQSEYSLFYKDLLRRLTEEIPGQYATPQPRSYYPISTGIGSVHYEWAFHGRPRSSMGVELHFEKGSREVNLQLLAHIEPKIPQLEKALQEKVIVQKEWGNQWSRLYISLEEGKFTEELRQWAVEKMAIMIRTLKPTLDAIA